jgi:oxygen-independent coproporphyrinogen-3 oxidase
LTRNRSTNRRLLPEPLFYSVVPPRHLYVHVPFCGRRCSYCDFAIAVRRAVPSDEFTRALEREIAIRFPDSAAAVVDTVYLGGGTPSRLGGAGVARLLDILRKRWSPAAGAEVTLEANPEDVTSDVVAAWRRSGVNRVSLGVQSFDDRILRWMHRAHDAARVRMAVDILRDGGVDNWSLDLIFALPAELGRDWSSDLDQAIALAPSHISCYGLAVEPGTPLDRWRARGDQVEGGEELFERDFLHADAALRLAGLEHYEVSNFARGGVEVFGARHNSAYWRRVPYVGLGPSAHSFDGGVRRWNEREYVAWGRRLAAKEDPVAGDERLSPTQVAMEEVYLGLRTSDGVQTCRADRRILEDWEAQGWGEQDAGRIRLTPRGWLRLDALAAALTESRSRF